MQKDAARWALDTAYGNSANNGFSIEGFTNLTISYTTAANANLRYAESSEPSTAWAYGPGSYTPAGDIWFGAGQGYRSPTPGTYEWATLIHETGHAMGLKHGHEPTTGFGQLPAAYNSMEFSVMTYKSYIGQPDGGGYTNETFGFAQTYMMADIAALQHMYGADYTTNSGNTVYKWNPNSGDTLVNGQIAIDAGGNRIFATIWDGGGIDTYDLSAYSTNLQIDLSPGGHSVFSNVQIAHLGSGNYSRGNIFNALKYQDDNRSLIENAIGGTGNDTIIGNEANNTLTGGAGVDALDGGSGNDLLYGGTGNDILTGGTGNDRLVGGIGADVLNGGAGTDTVRYATSMAVTVNLGINTATGGEAQGDTFIGIENVVGSQFNDILIGDSGANKLEGLNGDDFLRGGAGADTLIGYAGIDTADYSDSLASIDIGIHRIGTGGTSQGDHLIYMEKIIGSNFADTLVGGGPAAILEGMDGDDYLFDYGGSSTLNGGAGNDYINGGFGADTIDGGAGIDTISYADTSSVNINLETGVGTGFNAEGDTFINVENVIGSNAADTITGDAGDNRIEGRYGADLITGGGGNDQLFGGGHADVFIYDTTTFGRDLILDWQDNFDKIDLRGSGLTFDSFTVVDTPQGTRLDYFNGTETVAIHFFGVDPNQLDANDFLI